MAETSQPSERSSPSRTLQWSTNCTMIADGARSRITNSASKQVVCVARNYVDHCKELGNAVPKKPVFFFKPFSSVIFPPANIAVPKRVVAGRVEYEAEIVVVFGKTLKNVTPSEALQGIDGFTAAIDVTARELQEQEKAAGASWTLSKGFSTFCPILPNLLPTDCLDELQIKLYQNKHHRQDGSYKDMIFKIPELISYLSTIICINPGDILLTGTPAGVGPLEAGDELYLELSAGGRAIGGSFKVEHRAALRDGVTSYPLLSG